MVLRHTTGLPNWGDDKSAKLIFTPDSTFSYSGEGFQYLQHVVEKLTSKSLNELAEQEVFKPLQFLDFTASLIKAIVFGFTIGIVGCYQGYYSNKGTEGVGKAANGAVVTAMFLIFIEEIVIVQIAGWFR